MSTRAAIITQANKELGALSAGLSTTDDATGDFYYPLNNALDRMGKVDADVDSFTRNEVRVAVIGTKYELVETLWYKFYAHATKDGRAQFEHLERIKTKLSDEFMAALSGADTTPPEAPEYAEDVVVWGPSLKDPYTQTEQIGIDEFGDETTDEYED